MKFFIAVALLALFAVALAQPLESEKKIEPSQEEIEQRQPTAEAPRDKRGLVVSAAYTAPIAYTAYSSPYVYTANYHYPYAYSYRTYPYVYNPFY